MHKGKLVISKSLKWLYMFEQGRTFHFFIFFNLLSRKPKKSLETSFQLTQDHHLHLYTCKDLFKNLITIQINKKFGKKIGKIRGWTVNLQAVRYSKFDQNCYFWVVFRIQAFKPSIWGPPSIVGTIVRQENKWKLGIEVVKVLAPKR